MSLTSFLVTDVVIHCLQTGALVSSILLLFLSIKAKMISIPNLYLMHILVITDFLHALTIIPYTVHLTGGWNPISVNYDPTFIMISSAPLLIQLKVNLIVVIGIASDRLMALFIPTVYLHKNHGVYAVLVTVVAIIFGLCDVALNFYLSPIEPQPNCAAIGCFISHSFRYYWGTSNAILGAVVIILTLIMLCKLRSLSKNYPESEKTREGRRFNKANRSAVCTLVSSVIFITIPSIFAGVFEMTGYSIFRTIGPFYIVGLLCAGFCHCISQLKLNTELRRAFKKTVIGVSMADSSRFS